MKSRFRLFIALLLLLPAATCFGVTRYYLPSSGAAAVSPAFDSWGDTSTASPDRIKCIKGSPSSTTLTDKTGVIASANNFLFRQYVSDPIGVWDFTSTTVSGVVRNNTTSITSCTSAMQVSIRLFHSGGTFSTLLARATQDINWNANSPLTKIIASGTALSSVVSTNGDRLVIEWGCITTGTTSATRTMRFGDNAGSDFALTTNLTTDLNPWIEFSDNLPAATGGNAAKFFPFFNWLRWNFAKLTLRK